MAQCRDSSCKNSPFTSSVLEGFDDNLVEKLTLNDSSSLLRLHSSLKEQEGREDFALQKDFQEEIEKNDKLDITELDNKSCNSTSPKCNHIEEFTDTAKNKTEKPTSGVAFSIPLGKPNSTIRHPPKRLLDTAIKQHKENTIESLYDKQVLAETRRKQQRERKLQRIHARQEAARKLAEKVDILLQQRALAMGMADANIQRMPSSQILATANQVAHNFRNLTNQLDNDFAVKGTQLTKTQEKCPQNQAKKNNNCPKGENMPQSVWFTVDEPNERKTPSKKTVSFAKQQRKIMTAEELEEKQRQAEERRNKRIERRVKRCRETREALMNMAKDIEEFENLQSSPAGLKQRRETATLAGRIADRFDVLWQRYDEDLKRADNFYVDQPYVLKP